MRNFAKALEDYLTGPPKVTQDRFAKQCGIHKSKLSRILSESISVDRHTLDTIVEAVPSKDHEARAHLVQAYIKDYVSPSTLRHLESKKGGDPLADLDHTRLSPKGQAALKALARSDHLPDVEKIIINLASAFDLI